jgi:glycosyltransferase involved in cell wall biosynthesis
MSEAIHRQQGVELHADVPDVRPHLESAHAMVVPLRIGGGSRLKILEAAAAGVPVVSTAVGAEGLSLSPGQHYLEAESAESIADALAVLIRDRATGDRIATAACRHVQEHYGWDSCAERLDEIWRKCGRVNMNRSAIQESFSSR